MNGVSDEQRAAAKAALNGQPSKLFRLLSIADLADLPEPSWLVDRLLPARSFSVLYGPSGGGKTFVGLGLSLSVASGTPWLNVRDVTPGPVVYIAAEGAGGLKRRVDAWCTDQGVGPPAAFHFLPEAVNLLDEAAVDNARQTLETLSAPHRPALIVIDTMARCLVGGDENSSRDVGQFIHNVDQLRGTFDAAALVVHHTGKRGDEERGSSALRGAADAMLALSPADGGILLDFTKIKDHESPNPIALNLATVGESAAIRLGSNPGELGSSERQILRLLSDTFGSEEASTTRLLAVAQMSERTYLRALKVLRAGGYVATRKAGAARYNSITDLGKSQVLP